jgi:hypothetical protein
LFHIDLPTSSEYRDLSQVRSDACVSIYIPTTPVTQNVGASRIDFGNQITAALDQLRSIDFDKRRLADLEEQLVHVREDDEFWRLQANSLAVLATPDSVRTFRLANKLTHLLEVSDRFHLKPLLRAITFPHAAFILALSDHHVRLIEMSADLAPEVVTVSDMPKDISSIGKIEGTRPQHGDGGHKIRQAQYARRIDQALRRVLANFNLPLVLAATQPLYGIYRSVNSSANLLAEGISVSPDRMTPAELAAEARPLLDQYYKGMIADVKDLYRQRKEERRAISDLAQAARAATFGQIDTMLADIDEIVHGTVDDATGAITFGEEGPSTYGIGDEIANRVIAHGGKVLGVRKEDLPEGGALAAILRFPMA